MPCGTAERSRYFRGRPLSWSWTVCPFTKRAPRALLTITGATLLFLPPDSPALNPFAHDFATLKKLRVYNEQNSLDSLIQTYKY